MCSHAHASMHAGIASKCHRLPSVPPPMQLTAAVLQPVVLAGHQVLYSLWSLTSFLTVPLEQAALTFLPSARSEWTRTALYPPELHRFASLSVPASPTIQARSTA